MHAFVGQTDTFLIASLRWHHMQRGKKTDAENYGAFRASRRFTALFSAETATRLQKWLLSNRAAIFLIGH